VATALLRNEFSDLKIRFINVVDLAIRNEIGRYSIAIEAIDWAPSLRVTGAHAKVISKTNRSPAAITPTNTVPTNQRS
jgi:phosphoketolase